MNEIEKMRSGILADMSKPELQESFIHAKQILAKLRCMSEYDEDYRDLLEQLIPNLPSTSIICPPFYCDHGHGICIAEHVFINSNCTFLDEAYIRIGAHTLIGPDVKIYTPHHPMDYVQRRQNMEYAYPVTIGEDCWIGGGTIICPGVSIGDRCVIGAGSVVTKDIESDCVAVGNPARVIRRENRNRYVIRHTKITDIESVTSIFKYARDRMTTQGNPNQWTNNYPSKDLIINDIMNHNSYVIESDKKIIGVFTYILGDEPNYSYIDGEWPDNKPYGTIHRLAAAPGIKGIADAALDFAKKSGVNIRIDTHADNAPMLGWIAKRDFKYCGIIYVEDGTPRKAFQLNIL